MFYHMDEVDTLDERALRKMIEKQYPWIKDPVTWGLNRNERTILERLWEASPCIIPREVLINAIYSDQGKRECENADAVLKIVICRLRQKSRDLFTISTHYGQGYALKKSNAKDPATRIAELEKALEPFAAYGEVLRGQRVADDRVVVQLWDHKITKRDLVNAHEVTNGR